MYKDLGLDDIEFLDHNSSSNHTRIFKSDWKTGIRILSSKKIL